MKTTKIIILSAVALAGLGAGLGYSRFGADQPQFATSNKSQEQITPSTSSGARTMPSGTTPGSSPAPGSSTTTAADSTGISAPAPGSLAELVRASEVIVVGTVGSHTTTKFYGYDPDAARREEIDRASGGSSLAVPATDYDVAVERVLLDDGKLGSNGSLTLRIIGDPEYEKTMPTAGNRRLFFLILNPGGDSYGMSSKAAEIALDGEVASYRDGAVELLPFGLRLPPEEFIQRVLREVELQRTGIQPITGS